MRPLYKWPKRSLRAAITASALCCLVFEPAYAQQSRQAPFGGGAAGNIGNIGNALRQLQNQGRQGSGQQSRPGLGGARAGLGQIGGIGSRTGAPRPSGIGGAPSGTGASIIGGGAAPVSVIGGSGGGVRISGNESYEPAKDHPVVYGDLPDLGDGVSMTLIGDVRTAVDFLNDLSIVTGWNMLMTKDVEEISVRGWINEMPPQQAVEILKFHDIYYEYNSETQFLYVMTKDEYLEREFGKIEEDEFFIQHASLEDVEAVITSLMSQEGRMMITPATSRAFVWDTRDNLIAIRRAIEEIDVPLASRSFRLHHIDVEGLTDSIETILSETGELRVDARTNTLIVLDHKANQEKIASLIEAFDKPLETRTWILNYADAQTVAEQISGLIPDEMGLIATNSDLHQIIVHATPERLDDIGTLIEAWDQKRAQVQIEAYLITASRNVAREFGINWAFFGESGNDPFAFQIGNASPRFNTLPAGGEQFSIGQLPSVAPLLSGGPNSASVTDLIGQPLIRNFVGNELSFVLDHLEAEGDITILAHPRVTVQDGQEAIFENSTQVPFSQSTTRFGGGFGDTGLSNAISSISFIDVGTILRVLPRIAQDRNILLDISSEDSSFVIRSFLAGDQVNEVPQKTQNRTQTQVMVYDRETIVVGGLRTSSFGDDVNKVPILGDIPVLGRLFKSTKKNNEYSELLVFITPTIVDEYSRPESIKLANVDDEFARKMRSDKKNAFGRAANRFSGGKNEILVSIGQNGTMFSDGRIVDLNGLRTMFFENKRGKKVVIRRHPNAPAEVSMEVTEIAMEADLKIEFDETLSPLVPSLNPASSGTGEGDS